MLPHEKLSNVWTNFSIIVLMRGMLDQHKTSEKKLQSQIGKNISKVSIPTVGIEAIKEEFCLAFHYVICVEKAFCFQPLGFSLVSKQYATGFVPSFTVLQPVCTVTLRREK